MPNQDDIKALIKEHKRRLQKLKQHQAQKGITTDPSILTEIEDIEAQIKTLEIDLAATKQRANHPSEQPSANATTPPATFQEPQESADPTGAISPDSAFYIKRESVDNRLHQEIRKTGGTTITIRGPRQVGKTSLLAQAIKQANQLKYQSVYIDLQSFDDAQFSSLDKFLHTIATFIVYKLNLDLKEVENHWLIPLPPALKLDNLLSEYILPTLTNPLLLILDEVDKLQGISFQDTFFGLIRNWHNQRAINPIWKKLHLILAISTEPYLLIKNPKQSPFNVGVILPLQDFNEQQVCQLDALYGTDLCQQHLTEFMAYFGGHPYLSQRALYTAAIEHLTWDTLIKQSIQDESPFRDHLHRILDMLQQDPQLVKAMKQIIKQQQHPDKQIISRLLKAGLIKRGEKNQYHCRCGLYKQYLDSNL